MTKESISKRFNRSITKIVAFLLLAFALGVAIYGVNRMNSQLNDQLDYVSRLAGINLQLAIWNVDDKAIDEILNALFLDDDIVYLAVVSDGKITAKKSRIEFENSEFSFFEESSKFVSFSAPVIFKKLEIGKFQIAMSKANLKKNLTAQVIAIILLALLLILIITQRSMAVTRKMIFKPLMALENSASAIAGGNLDINIPHDSADEIGSLGKSFDGMRESIKKLITDLNKMNAELEQKITDSISDRKREEEALRNYANRIRLLQETAVAGNEANTVDEAMLICLKKVCEHTGWQVGHVYILNHEGKLAPSDLWNMDDPEKFKVFRAKTKVSIFEKGIGLPGRVYESAKPAWITDLRKDRNYPRLQGAEDIVIKSGFAFPVLEREKVTAVLEFYTTETTEADEHLMKTINLLATQLGRVTERKKAEEALRKSESRIKNILETTNEGFWMINNEAAVLEINPTMCDILGRDREEIIGEKIFGFVDENNLAIFNEQLKKRTEGNKSMYEIELMRPDGENVPCLFNATPLFDEVGIKVGSFAMITNITGRKRIEEELIEAKDKAEAANIAKSQFLSSMSHELRTPLNSILGFSQLMETDKDNPPNPSQKENLDQIQTSGKHLLNLINDVLDLTKIETGKIDISLESLSVKDLLKEIFPTMEPMAEKNSVKLIDKITDGEDIYIMADHTRFKQVLINLISNAIKYNQPSGTAIISLEKIRGSIVRITIEDTGKGISSENIPKLFEPFNRLGAEGLDIEGTGIGLTITRKLIKMMGGDISLISEVGKGSTFFVDIQRGKKPVIEMKETLISSQPDSKTVSGEKTVLYIEDNPANLKLVEKILSRRPNVKLLSSPDAKTGIELAIAQKPDLILMDINLSGGMDGYEALKTLQASDEASGIPVIALSANAMIHDIKRGKKAGFVDYLTKPIEINRFLETVDEVLRLNDRIK